MSNAQTNITFLSRISAAMKADVLSNIANHYGITNQQAENEVIDEDAENIMEYITGSHRSAIHLIYKKVMGNA
jgi:hypothetical protein